MASYHAGMYVELDSSWVTDRICEDPGECIDFVGYTTRDNFRNLYVIRRYLPAREGAGGHKDEIILVLEHCNDYELNLDALMKRFGKLWQKLNPNSAI